MRLIQVPATLSFLNYSETLETLPIPDFTKPAANSNWVIFLEIILV